MGLVPDDELKRSSSFNFAPMIDFLFLMLALFATLSISKATLFDAKIELVKAAVGKGEKPIADKKKHQIALAIGADGSYEWMTEFGRYPMEGPTAVQKELSRQYEMGALPKNRTDTEVLFHIDKRAPWDRVAKAIFAVKELGFQPHPVYEPERKN
jgi:biopolymer transport protein ExbD